MQFLKSSELFTNIKHKGLLAISYKTAKRMMNKGTFPKPTVQLSPGRLCWKSQDIENYIKNCDKPHSGILKEEGTCTK